ncbi:MAG: futalosine hydrolase [Bacteroidales bacterium]|nr:futalosine hydrolase [Bacteroidales bacterium]
MKILVTAAEEQELRRAERAFDMVKKSKDVKAQVEFRLTGIGAVQACHCVTREVVAAAASGEPYNLVVNLGIAGSYDLEAFPIGSAAVISREYFADLGFGSEEGFSDLFQYGILEKDDFPYTKGALARQLLPYPHIEKVLEKYGAGAGATVQCVTGTQSRCNEIVAMYNPQIESMEGAGVYYAALMEKVPFFELRTVSNAVGERDTFKWESKAALDTLEECCREIFSVI